MKKLLPILLLLPLILWGCNNDITIKCEYPNLTGITEVINTWKEISKIKDFWLWCDQIFEWWCEIRDKNKIDKVYMKAEPINEYSEILKDMWYECNYLTDEKCGFYYKTAHWPKYEDTSMEERIAHFYARYITEWWGRWCEWFCSDSRNPKYIWNNADCNRMCDVYFKLD